MNTLRRYWETHNGEISPLLHIHDVLHKKNEPLEVNDIKILAHEVGLPEAAVRSIISYYADLHSEKADIRICQGTSCMLAGADQVRNKLEKNATCQGVYCLGYCDRSPVFLTPQEEVIFGEAAQAIDFSHCSSDIPSRSVRCLSAQAIVTRRLNQDYVALDKARKAGAYSALEQALKTSPEAILSTVEQSGERGRGGASFPTGKKWRSCAEALGESRYVIANGDEGDPGSFIDRLLMEQDPHGVIEGMILCGYAVGATQGIIFIRSEYPTAMKRMREAISEAHQAGFLGQSILGSQLEFEISVFPAMGSYVCGEATAMINAIEGLRGEVRVRPPHMTEKGLYGQPTVVNNVETLVNIPYIIQQGAKAYAALGTEASSGTKAICLNHGFARPGVVEVEFGTSLADVITEAGGSVDGKPLEAVILGGPMGSILTPQQWDVPICYGAMTEQGIDLGHGGLVALPQGTDFRALLEHWLQFMKDESCGKCTPCRLGSQKAWNLVKNAEQISDFKAQLERLFEVMEQASFCAFGEYMPKPMRQIWPPAQW